MAGSLTPMSDQRVVAFYEDEVVALLSPDGSVWLPIRHLCELLGIDSTAQLRRIERDPVLAKYLADAPVTLGDGRTYTMQCLPLKYVRGWLFGISATRVKEAVRDKLIRYQEEVIEIIDRAFRPVAAGDTLSEAMMQAMRDNALQQAQLWTALLDEQRRLRSTEEVVQQHDDLLDEHTRQLARQSRALADLHRLQQEQGAALARLHDVTHLLPPPGTLQPGQKAALKELVDDLVAAALAQGIRLGQGRNDYPAVWGAFKQRFDVAKYDELPAARFDEALAWLKGWLDRVRASQP